MSSALFSDQTFSGEPSPPAPSTTAPTKRVVVRISAAARQLLLDYFTNTSTRPSRDARIMLADNVSRIDSIQYTPDQVNNWFANRRTNLSRKALDRNNTSVAVVVPEDNQPVDGEVLQALDTLYTRTPNASDDDVSRWCNDLRIPFRQGLRYIDQMHARRSVLQATSLPTPSSSASPEVRSRELPDIGKVEQETRREATADTELDEGIGTPHCPWLDELAARPMPTHLEVVQYPQSSFVPSNWYELDESLNEFRAALARLHTDHPGQDLMVRDSG